MKALFDSVWIHRIQMESTSGEVQLFCRVYEDNTGYDTEMFVSMSAFNRLMCELDVRGISLDMERDLDCVQVGPEEFIYTMDLSKDTQHPVFLPLVCLPKENRLLRA